MGDVGFPMVNEDFSLAEDVHDTQAEVEATQQAIAEANNDSQVAAVEDAEPRRPRGWLESDIKRLLDKVISGDVAGPTDAESGDALPLTPHRVAKLLAETEGLSKAPSVGAVSSVFDRWVKLDVVTMNEKPYSFGGFTNGAEAPGTDAIEAAKVAQAEARKAQKAAEKAAAAASAQA